MPGEKGQHRGCRTFPPEYISSRDKTVTHVSLISACWHVRKMFSNIWDVASLCFLFGNSSWVSIVNLLDVLKPIERSTKYWKVTDERNTWRKHVECLYIKNITQFSLHFYNFLHCGDMSPKFLFAQVLSLNTHSEYFMPMWWFGLPNIFKYGNVPMYPV